MKRTFVFLVFSLFIIDSGLCQQKTNSGDRILFHGIVKDASTFSPISNSHIFINRVFSSVSKGDGTFAFYVNRNDTVLFKHLGYKSTSLFVSDTLPGKEFIAGIYMNSDTLAIGEVIIFPRFINLKSQIINSPSKVPSTVENARYNVTLSAYQGRTVRGKLGDPSTNYDLLSRRQKVNAYEKGGIPSDQIAGLNPLLLLPAAYLLINGLPEKPPPLEKELSGQELDQIQKKYLETLQQRK